MKDENEFWKRTEEDFNKVNSLPLSSALDKGKKFFKWTVVILAVLAMAFSAIAFSINWYDRYKSDESYKYKLTLQRYDTRIYSFKDQDGLKTMTVFKPVNGGEIIYHNGSHYSEYYGENAQDGWPNEIYGYFRPIRNWKEINQMPEFKAMTKAEKDIARNKYIKARLERGLPDDTY